MIRFENVSKKFGDLKVLDNVSFEIRDGETFVIVGFSGAGKSVTIKHMIKLLTPDTGAVYVGGEPINEASGRQLERLRDMFGVLFQSAALLEWLTVGENVALPLHEKTSMTESEIKATSMETLARVGLEKFYDAYPSQISGGMRKRVGLARAIVTKPKIILYDEPTSGLDPVTSRSIDRLIEQMRAELKVTGVVVTHDLLSALAIGSRIAMIDRGKIVELATPEGFVRSQHPEVKRFLAAQHVSESDVNPGLEAGLFLETAVKHGDC